MIRPVALAVLLALPASAQEWGSLDCEVVRDFVEASQAHGVQARRGFAAIIGELNADRGYLPMDARERFDALTVPFSVWRPDSRPDAGLIYKLLSDRCDAQLDR